MCFFLLLILLILLLLFLLLLLLLHLLLAQQPVNSAKACLYHLAFSDLLFSPHIRIVSPTYKGIVYLGLETMTYMFLSCTR